MITKQKMLYNALQATFPKPLTLFDASARPLLRYVYNGKEPIVKRLVAAAETFGDV